MSSLSCAMRILSWFCSSPQASHRPLALRSQLVPFLLPGSGGRALNARQRKHPGELREIRIDLARASDELTNFTKSSAISTSLASTRPWPNAFTYPTGIVPWMTSSRPWTTSTRCWPRTGTPGGCSSWKSRSCSCLSSMWASSSRPCTDYIAGMRFETAPNTNTDENNQRS
jgi:hypothetical protein